MKACVAPVVTSVAVSTTVYKNLNTTGFKDRAVIGRLMGKKKKLSSLRVGQYLDSCNIQSHFRCKSVFFMLSLNEFLEAQGDL